MKLSNAVRWGLCLPCLCWCLGCAMWNRNPDPLDYDPLATHESQGFLGDTKDKAVRSTKNMFGLGPNEQVARDRYAEAMAQYNESLQLDAAGREKAFEETAKLFAKAASRWPSSSIEEDSLFYQSESLFFANRYPKAEEALGQLVKKYPSTKYLDNVSQRRFQLAKYWLEHAELDHDWPVTPNLTSPARPVFDKFGHALRVLENIRLDDPTGELADDATMLAATACFKAEKYYRADEFLTDLRRSFPNSNHQFEAHLLGLRCKIQLYQGPEYDSGPLLAAEELVKQMRRQFPDQASEHDEFLARAWKDVRMNQAIRDMNLARYRDRRKEYVAARAQYERVATDYSDTSLAAEAETRLAELGDTPENPRQPLEWLAKAFPTSSDKTPIPIVAQAPTTTGVSTR